MRLVLSCLPTGRSFLLFSNYICICAPDATCDGNLNLYIPSTTFTDVYICR